MNVIVIYTSEDGIYFNEYTEEEFTEQLASGEYSRVKWCSSLRQFDKEACNNGIIVKGGTVVQPKPVEVVTKYTL